MSKSSFMIYLYIYVNCNMLQADSFSIQSLKRNIWFERLFYPLRTILTHTRLESFGHGQWVRTEKTRGDNYLQKRVPRNLQFSFLDLLLLKHTSEIVQYALSILPRWGLAMKKLIEKEPKHFRSNHFNFCLDPKVIDRVHSDHILSTFVPQPPLFDKMSNL